MNAVEVAILGGVSASQRALPRLELEQMLSNAGVATAQSRAAIDALIARGCLAPRALAVDLTPSGIAALLGAQAALAAAMGVLESCPSIPYLTTVQTKWVDAISINYACDPAKIAKMLPAPLEPEIHKGTAWVQILMSSLRDMRPQGMPSLFGVCFYQASYRAAVRYRSEDGEWHRGGYFVRSETNHEVMRAVGNSLAEFKFHAFGASTMTMLRDGDRLTIGSDPEPAGGKLVGMFDTRPLSGPPAGSVWASVAELHEPLVECYDAYGVDRENGWLYTLTIDRDPWNPRFVTPLDLYSEWAEAIDARLDSVLHVRECPYRWRPLRRERVKAG